MNAPFRDLLASTEVDERRSIIDSLLYMCQAYQILLFCSG